MRLVRRSAPTGRFPRGCGISVYRLFVHVLVFIATPMLRARFMMVMPLAFGVFVLLLFFLEHLWRAQASLRGQVPDVTHDGPRFVVVEDALPPRHS